VGRSSNSSPTGRYTDWAGIITRLRRTPGRWSREFTDVPATKARDVRLRRHPDLHIEGARLEAQLTNKHQGDDGHWRGDLYLRYVVDSPPDNIDIDPNQGQKGHPDGDSTA
jgi:hypothetical protein